MKRTVVFLFTILMVHTMVYGQENKKALIFLEANIRPQAYLQDGRPMVPLEVILDRRYSHTSFEFAYKKEKDKIILQNTSGVDVRTIADLKKEEFITINLPTNQFVIKNKTYNFSRIPQIIEGNTYISADFFVKAFGYPVAVDVNTVHIGYPDVQRACTEKDITLFVEKKSQFPLILNLTEEEWEKGITDI